MSEVLADMVGSSATREGEFRVLDRGTPIDAGAVVLRVSRLYRDGMNVDAVYDITRGWWVIGDRRDDVEYAIAVAGTTICGAFRVFGWVDKIENGKIRWGFDGEPADELRHLLGTDVAALFPPGAANPVRYVELVDGAIASDGVAVEDEQAAASELPRVSSPAEKTLQELCRELDQNPMLAVSLGSKELFHSNLLGWVLEHDEDLAREVLEPYQRAGDTEPFEVWREHKQLDLVVRIPGWAPIVLENKVFSFPDHSQLDGYATKNIPQAGLSDPVLLLLSLPDPGWDADGYHGWRHVTWPGLVHRVLSAVRSRRPAEDFTRQVVEHWAAMVHSLDRIIELAGRPGDAAFSLDGETRALLATVRLEDVIAKFRARSLGAALQQELTGEERELIAVHSDITRGQVLLDVKVNLADSGRIGWQLQGSQWRRFVITPASLTGKTDTLRLAREDYVRSNHAGWLDFTTEAQRVTTLPANNSNLKHFAPEFVYDYVKVPGISTAQVLDLGLKVAREALAYARATS